MKKEIPQEWIELRINLKCEWAKEGSPGDFYEWLLNKIENRIKVQ